MYRAQLGRFLVGMVFGWRAVRRCCWSRGQAREITDRVVTDGDTELSAHILRW